ncbi:MAG: hypothetical protein IT370_35505 [Deltaproteobacteria bacterium]|nr:hypothetical protein [Deltaproteobacteria bacterium]
MRRLALALAQVMALALALVTVTACTRHTLRGADPKVPVRLPRDHAGHGDAQTEWWHFHGHLIDAAGGRHDFFLGFVRQHTDRDKLWFLPVRWFVDPFHVAYFTVTDRAAGRFDVREKHSYPDTWAASASNTRLALRHDSWRAAAAGDGFTLDARTRHQHLTLRMDPATAPALLGKRGYLDVPPRSAHYYYSIPLLTARGTLTVNGKARAVSGTAWLKHEWGFMYTDHLAGWVWFGVQLGSGHQLEIGLIFDRRWNLAPGSFAVVEEPGGGVTPIVVNQLGVLESGETWRSPRTGTVYPTGWALEVPGRGTLILRAPVPGQEMVVFPANLWAGSMEVSGDFDGAPALGDAFVEFLGLDTPFGRSLLHSGRPE